MLSLHDGSGTLQQPDGHEIGLQQQAFLGIHIFLALYLERFYTIIRSIVYLMKYFLTPLRTNGAGFRISKITKSIKSKINKN